MAAQCTDSEKKDIFISKNSIKRLLKDVKDIINNPLTDSGIYYKHSETDILSGQALIIGPQNTPYASGYYLFNFKFPNDYPHKPPVVTYHTNDGTTRFNPNLYRSGKVCVSILNTWRGPQWTGCQSITSILLCLCTAVLNDKPLLNEPGINNTHADYKNYTEIITYKNYDVAIGDMLFREDIKKQFPELHKEMCIHFLGNYKKIMNNISQVETEEKIITTSLYKMKVKINYSRVKEKLEKIYQNLTKLN